VQLSSGKNIGFQATVVSIDENTSLFNEELKSNLKILSALGSDDKGIVCCRDRSGETDEWLGIGVTNREVVIISQTITKIHDRGTS
jgi:hypothetical protein